MLDELKADIGEEAFEIYIHFLHLSNYVDIKKFKASIMIR
jgi:hypothetical protein